MAQARTKMLKKRPGKANHDNVAGDGCRAANELVISRLSARSGQQPPDNAYRPNDRHAVSGHPMKNGDQHMRFPFPSAHIRSTRPIMRLRTCYILFRTSTGSVGKKCGMLF